MEFAEEEGLGTQEKICAHVRVWEEDCVLQNQADRGFKSQLFPKTTMKSWASL